MKYCPSCQTTYSDESLRFCLQDGTNLLDYSVTLQRKMMDLGERETVVRRKPITSELEQSQITRVAALQPQLKRSNAPLILILTAAAMFVFLGVIGGIWLLLNGGSSGYKVSSNINGRDNLPTPFPTSANTNGLNNNEKTNSVVNSGTRWEPLRNNVSLQGKTLTFYRGTTPERCQADCDANQKCHAFTFIRAGAYNPGDPQMCYLISEVSYPSRHACCISAVKIGVDDGNRADRETFKACDFYLGSGLYNKWKEMGGEDGKLGCPVMSEAEAEPSPQGTTGRYTRFVKGDGGYIIWHGSGRFAGTSFEVSGCMFKLYYDLGGTRSWLGFPIKDGFFTSTGARQDFEGGYILWDSKTYNCQAYKN